MTRSTGSNGKEVTFVFNEVPQAVRVYLAGTFNGWNPAAKRMVRYRDGSFRAKVSLAPGVHEYKFVADGLWLTDSAARQQAPNPFGTLNSVVRVE